MFSAYSFVRCYTYVFMTVRWLSRALLANKTEATGIIIIARWPLENNLNVWWALLCCDWLGSNRLIINKSGSPPSCDYYFWQWLVTTHSELFDCQVRYLDIYLFYVFWLLWSWERCYIYDLFAYISVLFGRNWLVMNRAARKSWSLWILWFWVCRGFCQSPCGCDFRWIKYKNSTVDLWSLSDANLAVQLTVVFNAKAETKVSL